MKIVWLLVSFKEKKELCLCARISCLRVRELTLCFCFRIFILFTRIWWMFCMTKITTSWLWGRSILPRTWLTSKGRWFVCFCTCLVDCWLNCALLCPQCCQGLRAADEVRGLSVPLQAAQTGRPGAHVHHHQETETEPGVLGARLVSHKGWKRHVGWI